MLPYYYDKWVRQIISPANGGRSEARILHLNVVFIHGDFRSQYPYANALMKLQDLLLALEGVDTQAKRFLETVALQDFQRKDTWLKLRGASRECACHHRIRIWGIDHCWSCDRKVSSQEMYGSVGESCGEELATELAPRKSKQSPNSLASISGTRKTNSLF
jgi:hypothetical protein